MNKAILTGRIGSAPEMRTFDSGKKVLSASLATSERWKDKEGNKKEATEWHNLKMYGANPPEQCFQKGNLITVEGKIKTEKYQDKQGNSRYNTYILVENVEVHAWANSDKPAQVSEPVDEHGYEPMNGNPF